MGLDPYAGVQIHIKEQHCRFNMKKNKIMCRFKLIPSDINIKKFKCSSMIIKSNLQKTAVHQIDIWI